MIFELEDLEGTTNPDSPDQERPTLQFIESSTAPVRRRKARVDGLSQSFSGLRPLSLPVPSNMRPPRSQHGSDLSSPSMILSLPRPLAASPTVTHTSSSIAGPSGTSLDSKAWQTFTRRKPEHHGTEGIPEEGEDDGADVSGFAVPEMVPSRRKIYQASGNLESQPLEKKKHLD